MTNTRKATAKIASVFLIAAMLLGVMCMAFTVSAGAATYDRVKLYSASPYFVKYGMTTYEVFIQTKDNAVDQKVYVHYNYMNGQPWQDREAEYFTTLNQLQREILHQVYCGRRDLLG